MLRVRDRRQRAWVALSVRMPKRLYDWLTRHGKPEEVILAMLQRRYYGLYADTDATPDAWDVLLIAEDLARRMHDHGKANA